METLNFKGHGNKSSDGVKNILTPLVDCFAIILIYLLMATTFANNELTTPEGMKLPKATETKSAETTQAIVEVKNKLYYINKKQILLPQLAVELKKLAVKTGQQEPTLIIQADKSLSYGEMNPAVVAGLQAGFSELQFAVIKEDTL